VTVLPPHSLEAERAVLGSVLLSPPCMDDVLVLMRATDFYRDGHRVVFDACVALHAKAQPIEPDSVMEVLKAVGRSTCCDTLDDTGGTLVYLLSLLAECPSAANVTHYAALVSDYATQRRVIAVAHEVQSEAHQPRSDVGAWVSDVEARVAACRGDGSEGGPVLASALSMPTYREIERRRSDGRPVVVPTGLPCLDKALLIGPEELHVVGGRSGYGKTALGFQVACYVAEHVGPVVWFSLEMPAAMMAQRAWSGMSGIEQWRIKSGRVTNDELATLSEAAGTFSGWPLWIDDSPTLTAQDVRARSRLVARKAGRPLAMIGVDYIGRVATTDKGDNREQRLADSVRAFKTLAREMKCPVLLLAQLNRVKEETDRPGLGSLRETASLEHECDAAWLLYGDNHSNRLTVTIAKQRNGPTGDVTLGWHGDCVRFYDPNAAAQGDAWNQRADLA